MNNVDSLVSGIQGTSGFLSRLISLKSGLVVFLALSLGIVLKLVL